MDSKHRAAVQGFVGQAVRGILASVPGLAPTLGGGVRATLANAAKIAATAAAGAALGRVSKAMGNARSRRTAKRAMSAAALSTGSGIPQTSFRRTTAPAISSIRTAIGNVGLQNRVERFTYNPLQIYVGNNTLGVANNVYLLSTTTGSDLSVDLVPIGPSDTKFGSTYITDIWKHFARKRFRRIVLHIVPEGIGASTTLGATIAVAPVRGGDWAYTMVANNTTNPTYSIANVMSNSGAVSAPLYEGISYDLTPYIANPAGGNEFMESVGTALSGQLSELVSHVVPCAFLFACNNVNGQQAVTIGRVYIDVEVEMLDFIGINVSNPELTRRKTAEKTAALASAAPAAVASGLVEDYVLAPSNSPAVLAAPTPTELSMLRLRRQTAIDTSKEAKRP